MSNRDMMHDIAQSQAADLIGNLMDLFNKERDTLLDLLKRIDITKLVDLAQLVILTSSNATANNRLVQRINRLQKQRGRRNENVRLTKKRRLQLEMELIKAIAGDQSETKNIFLGVLRKTMETTHMIQDKALVPKSLRDKLHRLKEQEDEFEDID